MDKRCAHDLTLPLLDEFVNLWGLIDEVNFDSNNQEPDAIRWTRTASGEYTTKSAYEMQFEGGILLTFPKLVWNIWAPSKCKFFMWLLLHNRLWTADHLLMREWPNSYFYLLCVRNLETAQHLFSECPFSCLVWKSVGDWCHCHSFDPAN